MDLKNIDHQSFYYFYQVARLKNFTEAAKASRCSKSHMSKSIHQLEVDLQTKLFQRTTRQLQLTESGEQLLSIVTVMFEQLQYGIDQLQDISNKPAGHIKISSPPGLAQILLAPLLGRFLKKYADISLHCSCESHIINMVKDGYDIAFRNAQLEDANYIARHLTDIQYVCVAANTCSDVVKTIKHPNDITQYKTFSYDMPDGVQWVFEHKQQQVHLKLNPTFTSNLSMVVLATLQQSKGIAMLPDFLVKKLLQEKKLVKVLPRWKLKKIPLYLVYPSKDFMPLKTRVFIDYTLKHFGKH